MDDDEPPLLVSGTTGQDEENIMSAEMEGVVLNKVPITIVTGRSDIYYDGFLVAVIVLSI